MSADAGDADPADPPAADCCRDPNLVARWASMGSEQVGWTCEGCGATLDLDGTVESTDADGDDGGSLAPYTERFIDFYRDAVPDAVNDLEESWAPGSRSLRCSYDALHEYDARLAEDFLSRPEALTERAIEALREYSTSVDKHIQHGGQHARVNIRVHGLPDERTYRVGKYRTRHLGSVIAVRGKVIDTEDVAPLCSCAAWECQRCGTLTRMDQQYGNMIKPSQCLGCEAQGPLELHWEASDLVDFQEIALMPVDSALDDPPVLTAYLLDDLTDSLGKGDQVTLIGHYDIHPQQNETELATYMEVIDIEGAQTEAGTDTAEIRPHLLEVVQAEQDGGDGWGVDRETLVDAVLTPEIREEEIRDVLEELLDDGDLHETNGLIVHLGDE